MQVSDGVRGSSVDQPQQNRQTRADTDPQTPHPVQWTYPAQSGQEELLHHQVAQSLKLPPVCDGLIGKVGQLHLGRVSEDTRMD